MAIISISEAAKRVGVARSTIYKKIRDGVLQEAARPNGSKGVDTDELRRVFGELQQPREKPEPVSKMEKGQAETGQEVQLLQQQVNLLQQQLEACQRREQRLQALLEREQQMLPGPIQGVVDGVIGVFCGIWDWVAGKKEPAKPSGKEKQV